MECEATAHTAQPCWEAEETFIIIVVAVEVILVLLVVLFQHCKKYAKLKVKIDMLKNDSRSI